MKKIFVLLGLILIACASVQDTSENRSTVIEYKVRIHRMFADSIWAKLKKRTPNVELQSKVANLKSMEKPDPSFYTLVVQDSASKLSYIEALDINNNSRLVRHVTPFTDSDSYKFIDSSAVYVDMTEKLPNVYMKKENLEFTWTDTKEDSIILGIKTHLMIGRSPTAKIRAWVTSKFPEDLSIYDVYNEDGFVLAYELSQNSKPPFKSIERSVYPIKIKLNNKNGFSIPVLKNTKIMTKREVLEYIGKLRKSRQ